MKWIIGGTLLIALFLIGFVIHPDCTKNCTKQPGYYYGIPLPNTTYSTFYGVSSTGKPIVSSEDEVSHTVSSEAHDAPVESHSVAESHPVAVSAHGGE